MYGTKAQIVVLTVTLFLLSTGSKSTGYIPL